jgi:glutathione S-transferase
MPETLTFYTNPQSRGQIVRWMLEEVAAPYETVLLDYGTTMKEPAYLAINPMGKVPAIKHGDQVVTECAAICAYLADAFPGAGLLPDAAHRGAYYRWMFFASGPTEQAIINNALGVVVPPERSMMVGCGSFDAMVDALEGAVIDRPYIAGDHFSAADVYVGSQIDWGLSFGTLPKRPAFEAYAAPFRERPAYRRAKLLDAAKEQ